MNLPFFKKWSQKLVPKALTTPREIYLEQCGEKVASNPKQHHQKQIYEQFITIQSLDEAKNRN